MRALIDLLRELVGAAQPQPVRVRADKSDRKDVLRPGAQDKEASQ